MAIKGLTDKMAAFPVIGELRKGEKKPNENRPGADLTYFRFTSEDTLALAMFSSAYPNEDALRNINVFLPYKTAEENMDSWIEKWVAGGLVYRSDGETMVLWRTQAGAYSKESQPDPCPEIDGNGKRKDGSGHVGRLSVIVPELGRFATITVLTTSKNDIMNLTSQLRSYEALRGDLRGIPFVLKRRPHKISTPGQDGKRVRREKWLLSIETQPQWTLAQLGAMEQAALPSGEIVIDSYTGEADYPEVELPVGVTNPFEDNEPAEVEPQPKAQPAVMTFSNLDELLFQLNKDFKLTEVAAKNKIKDLGFKTLPAGNGELKTRLQEMYTAVKASQADATAQPHPKG
jgi:hypothetical protein